MTSSHFQLFSVGHPLFHLLPVLFSSASLTISHLVILVSTFLSHTKTIERKRLNKCSVLPPSWWEYSNNPLKMINNNRLYKVERLCVYMMIIESSSVDTSSSNSSDSPFGSLTESLSLNNNRDLRKSSFT
jgi:hypothetical protein